MDFKTRSLTNDPQFQAIREARIALYGGHDPDWQADDDMSETDPDDNKPESNN